MEFGDAVKMVRADLNLTQKELAKRCNLSPSGLSHFESGRRPPSLKHLRNIREALGCSYDLLLDTKGTLE